MPTDINELDVNDIGLKGIFGKRFEDETVPTKAEPNKASTFTIPTKKPRLGIPDELLDAPYAPIKADPSFNQKLMDTAKWSGLFASLSLLFFYWQQTGQMQPSAAVPAMCACTAMVGWSIGKNARGR